MAHWGVAGTGKTGGWEQPPADWLSDPEHSPSPGETPALMPCDADPAVCLQLQKCASQTVSFGLCCLPEILAGKGYAKGCDTNLNTYVTCFSGTQSHGERYLARLPS